MVVWRRVLPVLAIMMVAPACTEVWGLDTLNVGEAGPTLENDGSPPGMGDDSSPGRDGGTMDDGGNRPPHRVDGGNPPEGGSDAGLEDAAGTCTVDPTVSCTSLGVAYAGFSCTGTAQPATAGATGAICTAVGTVGDITSYCCQGNWCGETGGDSCDACLAAECPSPECLCDNLGPSVDSQGDTACDTYAECVFNCNGSYQECESSCASGYTSNTLAAGNAFLACVVANCSSPCGG
jgi:hypothetical protein